MYTYIHEHPDVSMIEVDKYGRITEVNEEDDGNSDLDEEERKYMNPRRNVRVKPVIEKKFFAPLLPPTLPIVSSSTSKGTKNDPIEL